MSISDEEFYDAKDLVSPQAPKGNTMHLPKALTSSFQATQQHTLLSEEYDHMNLQDSLDSEYNSSLHPLAEQIRRRTSIPSVYIYEDHTDSQSDQPFNTDNTLSPPSHQPKHSITRKKSMDLLSRIGLRKYPPTSGSNKSIQEKDSDNDSSSDEHPSTTIRHHRRSIESTRSFMFGNQHLPPHGERYIKIKSKAKTQNKALSKLVLAQILTKTEHSNELRQTEYKGMEDENHAHPNRPHQAIWAMKFSKDGKYLAAGGQNCVLRVWEILSEKLNHDDGEQLDTIKVFNETPIQEYHGHKADILDISWSKNNFLLSSSMDKTVRLWHVTKSECLCVFVHLDFVTGIKFHPKDDRFFLSGSLDSKVRLWSITDKKVAFWNEVPNENLITAVGFTLDGRTACVGSYTGQVYFYETQGLKYNTQINVKKRGAKKGKKITGIEAMPNMPPGDEKLLITSNDSRIRMINMKDKSLIYKYKGLDNSTMQIMATFSDDGRYIICGSEDCSVYLWPTGHPGFSSSRFSRDMITNHHGSNGSVYGGGGSDTSGGQPSTTEQGLGSWLKRGEQRAKEKLQHHHEFFEAHKSTITNAIFASHRTRQQLALTGHDIILNHTPIPDDPPCLNNNDDVDEDDDDDDNTKFIYKTSEKYDYPDSQIIVTSDVHGCIQVWRTDSGIYTQQQQQRKSIDSSFVTPSLSGKTCQQKRPFTLFSGRVNK